MQSAEHLSVAPGYKCIHTRPGAGHFTVEADHAAVGKMLRDLVEMKLRHFLEQGEMHQRPGDVEIKLLL